MKDRSLLPAVSFVLHGSYERQIPCASCEFCPSWSLRKTNLLYLQRVLSFIGLTEDKSLGPVTRFILIYRLVDQTLKRSFDHRKKGSEITIKNYNFAEKCQIKRLA